MNRVWREDAGMLDDETASLVAYLPGNLLQSDEVTGSIGGHRPHNDSFFSPHS